MIMIGPCQNRKSEFVGSEADICFYSGVGKTTGLMLAAAQHIETPNYGAVIFGRSTSEIFREDGIWEQSHMWFPAIDGKPVKTQGEWRFPVGSSIAFRPMREGGKDLARYCGSQLAFIGFDNITRFTNSMFIFLLSRNRTTCGVKPHVNNW